MKKADNEGAWALLRNAEFRRFWWARSVAVVANQMLLVALGWQMYDLTASAWDLGLVGLYQFMPALVLALVAGHVNDRHDRRVVLASCLAGQLVVAVTLLAATRGGWAQRRVPVMSLRSTVILARERPRSPAA